MLITDLRIRGESLALIFLMTVLFILGSVFLCSIGNEQLKEEMPELQFFADSNTYIKTYLGDADNFEGGLIKVDANYFGPISILNLASGNNYFVLMLNIFIYTASILAVCATLNLDPWKLGVLLLINPLTLSSLLSVNKEIFLFPFIAFALGAYVKRSLILLCMALLCTALVRWQLSIFYILVLLLIQCSGMMFSRMKVLGALLLFLSVAYLAIQPIIQPILFYVQQSFDSYEGGGSGLFEAVLEAQNKGFYFAVFPVKAFHLLYGMGFKLDGIISPVDLYNDFFVAGHCAITLLLSLTLLIKRSLTFKSDFIYLAILYLAIFCLTPVFAPRYLYIIYVFGALVAVGAPRNLHTLKTLNN